MIMRTVLTLCFAILSLAVATPEAEPSQQPAVAQETNVTKLSVDTEDANENVNVTEIAATFIKDYVTPTICSYSPETCAKNQIEGRGIQSYLATAGTLFAGALGVIWTKINILVALSLVTTIMGKLLMFYVFFYGDPHHYHGFHHHHGHKGHHHHHGHHAPFVKYTKDKYYIKNSPVEHNHDVIVSEPPHHHSPYHSHPPSGGVSYYKR